MASARMQMYMGALVALAERASAHNVSINIIITFYFRALALARLYDMQVKCVAYVCECTHANVAEFVVRAKAARISREIPFVISSVAVL